MLQKSHALLPGLLLIGVLVLLSGCGLGTDSQPGPLVIAYMPYPERPPQTARIASADTAQRLYNAILALPSKQPCESLVRVVPTYQLVFRIQQQVISGNMDTTCQTITLDGKTYKVTYEFMQLFTGIVSGAVFALAEPDHLTLTIDNSSTSGQQSTVGDTMLIGQLYHKVLTLRSTTPRPDYSGCLSADSAAGTGKRYSFAFSQWDLPVYEFVAYEGSCTFVLRSTGNIPVQGDQALWDLIHQAASQP